MLITQSKMTLAEVHRRSQLRACRNVTQWCVSGICAVASGSCFGSGFLEKSTLPRARPIRVLRVAWPPQKRHCIRSVLFKIFTKDYLILS